MRLWTILALLRSLSSTEEPAPLHLPLILASNLRIFVINSSFTPIDDIRSYRRVWSPRGSMGSEHLGQVREGEGWWTGSRSLREAAMPNWELVRRRDVGGGVAEKVWGSPRSFSPLCN